MDQVLDLLDIAAKSYPIKALAPDIGKGESTLRNELTQQPGYKLGLMTAFQIISRTGDLKALDRIEALLGRVAFTLPKSESKNMTPLMQLVAKLTKEFSEHMDAIALAMADGKLDKHEIEKCQKELKDLIEACVNLQAYFEQF